MLIASLAAAENVKNMANSKFIAKKWKNFYSLILNKNKLLKYQIKGTPTKALNLSIVEKICFKKNNFYYLNANGNYKKIEFTNLKYSKIVQDKIYLNIKIKTSSKRSDILANEVLKDLKKIKILDYGCNQFDLLIKLKRLGYKNLFGHDINFYFSKYLKKKD